MRYGSLSERNGASGPDGYEAFENTNNKKKRKIPTSGGLSLHHSTLTNELANMGINGIKDGSNSDRYHGSTSSAAISGLGLQGAGRGRSSRRASGRHPLGVSVNGSNVRSGSSKYETNGSQTTKGKVLLSRSGYNQSIDNS